MSRELVRSIAKKLALSPSFTEKLVDLMASEIDTALQAEAGGDRIYIAKTASRTEKAARDDRLRARFNGKNYADLAKEEGLTERQVRRIVDRKEAVTDAP